MYKFDNLTEWYIRSVPIGSLLTTKGLIETILRTTGKQIAHQKAARLLDAHEMCAPIETLHPRTWKRIG